MKKIFQSLSALMLLSMATVVSAGQYTPGRVTVYTNLDEGYATIAGSFNVRQNAATGGLGYITVGSFGNVSISIHGQDSTTGAMFSCSVSYTNPLYSTLKRYADHAADGMYISVYSTLTGQCYASLFENSSKYLH